MLYEEGLSRKRFKDDQIKFVLKSFEIRMAIKCFTKDFCVSRKIKSKF